jgi:RHS repeat-associated protein
VKNTHISVGQSLRYLCCLAVVLMAFSFGGAVSAQPAAAQISSSRPTLQSKAKSHERPTRKPIAPHKLAEVTTLAQAPRQIRETLERESFNHGLTASYSSSGAIFVGPGFAFSVGTSVVSEGQSNLAIANVMSRGRGITSYGEESLSESFRNISGGRVEQSFHILNTTMGAKEVSITIPVSSLNATRVGNTIDLHDSKHRILAFYSGLRAVDASGKVIKSSMSASDTGHSIIITVDARNARFPLTVDPDWGAIQELYPSSTSPTAFGFVAMSGSTIAVGAPLFQDSQGVVIVFGYSTENGWTETKELSAGDGDSGDLFGASISISGTEIAIGAPQHSFDMGVTHPGAVYVFSDSGGTWNQMGPTLEAEDGSDEDGFGTSVSLSGSTLAVGAPELASGLGAAYVFNYNYDDDDAWSEVQEFFGAATGDGFGTSVADSGTDILVGAPNHSDAGSDTGAVYDYIGSGAAWYPNLPDITPPAVGESVQNFGTSISVSGDTAIIGAPGYVDDEDAAIGAGFVYVSSDGTWSEDALIPGPTGAGPPPSYATVFGYSVAISGSTIVIGAPEVYSAESSWVTGGAYIYQYQDGEWVGIKLVIPSDATNADLYGISVGVSGSNIIVGAPLHQIYRGAAYIYNEFSSEVTPVGTWTRLEPVGGGSPSEPRCGCGGGRSTGGGRTDTPDAISPLNGDFYETTTDVKVPGPGEALQFTRTYDALVAQDQATPSSPDAPGPLGYGWSDNLGMTLSYDPTSEVATIDEENGAHIQFTADSMGTPSWTCPSGTNFCADAPRIEATLNHNSDGSWTFVREVSGATTFTFSSTGSLLSIANAENQSIDMAVGTPGVGACPSTATSCAVWTSSVSGKTLTEVFDSSGRLTKVTDGADNTVAFCYYAQTCASGSTGGSQDLYSATDPDSMTTTYTYDSANATTAYDHDILTLVPPGGTYTTPNCTLTPPGGTGETTNCYNSSGEISQQENPGANVLLYSYSGDESSLSGGSTTVTSYPGAGETGTPEEWTYDYSSNVLVGETAGDDSASASTEYMNPDPVSLTSADTADGNNNVVSDNLDTYDLPGATPVSSGDVLTSTDTMGNTTEYAYTPDNLIWCTVEPAEYANGVNCPSSEPSSPPTSGDGATIDIYNSPYDELTSSTDPLGNTTIHAYTPSGGSVPGGLEYCSIDPAEFATYIAANPTASYPYSCPPSPPTSPPTGATGYTTEIYNSTGQMTSSTTPNGATTTYTYEPSGVAGAGLVETQTDPQGDTTTFDYNAAGQVTQQIESNPSGTFEAVTLSAYDSSGRLFCQVAPDQAAEGVECPSSPPSSVPTPGSDPDPGATITTYDNVGRVIQTTNPLGGVSITVYDESGNAFCTAGAAAVAAYVAAHPSATYPYMCPSTPPSSPPTTSSDPYLGATLTTYDTLGRAVQVTTPIGGITLTTYDQDGNILETQVESNDSTNAPTVTTTHTYDLDGQVTSTTTGTSTTFNYYDPDGKAYCTVSANAYAGYVAETSYYQCAAWQTSWIDAPPSLYSLISDSNVPVDVTTSFYDPDGNLVESINPNYDTSVSTYDADGRVYCSASPANVANYLSANPTASWPYLCPTILPTSPPTGTPGYTTTMYDDQGNVLSSTDPTGNTTTYTYDSAGNKLSSTDAAGNKTSYCYYYENATGQCAASTTRGSWSSATSRDSGETFSQVSCPSATFCAVGDSGGKVFTDSSGSWSSGTTLISGEAITSLSCASSTLCAAGTANGEVFVFSGTSWSTTGTTLDSGVAIESMSCAPGFCVAGDAAGHAYTYPGSGSAWTSYTLSSTGVAVQGVSCPVAGWCQAVVGAAVFNLTSSGWSSGTALASGHQLKTISCPNQAFCVAGSNYGSVYAYTAAGGWSSATALQSGSAINQISCTPSKLCAAVTQAGNAYTFNGMSWSSATTLNSGVGIASVSCASWWFCAATDASGNAYTYGTSGWSEPVTLSSASGVDAVDCATPNSCVAGDGVGNTYNFHGNPWTPPNSVNGTTHALNAVSCPTDSSCFAVNNSGKAFFGTGENWLGYNVSSGDDLESLSCPTSSQCEVGDNSGNAITLSRSTSGWSSTTSLLASGKVISSVSCASTSSCWAGASNGKVYKYSGTWSSSTCGTCTLDTSVTVTSLSCPTTSFCVASNAAGLVYTYNGTSWSSGTPLQSGKSIYVSCASMSFCAAVSSAGKTFIYTGSGWPGTQTGSPGFTAMSCSSSSYCVAVDESGDAFSYNGSTWTKGTDVDGGTTLESVSCVLASFCVATDGSGNALDETGGGFANQLYSTTLPPTPADPAGDITTDSYTPSGETAIETKPSGQTIDSYDYNDDLTQVDYLNTATGYSTPADVSYTYNPDGSRASMIDGTGTTDYSYDDSGDTTEVQFTPKSGTGLSSQTVGYGYYSTGVLNTMTYPSYGTETDPVVTYAYNAAGGMASMTDWLSNATTFTYDSDQNLTAESMPTTNSGGTAVDYSYDPADNLTDTTVVDSAIWTTSPYSEDLTNLTLNPDSLIATSTPASGTSTTLDYDADDRLLTGLGDTYAYDTDGRLASDSPASGSATYNSYDTGSELCATQAGSSPLCAFPGSSTTVYGYNSDGDRCYQATGSTAGTCSSPPVGSTLGTYGWDQAGDMTCVTVANSSNATCASPNTTYSSNYVYNGDGLRVADIPAGGSEQQFTWDSIPSIPRIIRDGSNEYLYGPTSNMPIEQIGMSTDSISFLVSDNQGVRLVVNTSGVLDGTANYNSYGQTIGSTGSPFEFDGEYADATGLDYLVHRYYDPLSGQFMSVDPDLVETGEPYVYTADDPTNNTDPSGLHKCDLNPLTWWGCAENGLQDIESWLLSPFKSEAETTISGIEDDQAYALGGSDCTPATESPASSPYAGVANVANGLRLPDYLSLQVSGGIFGVVGGVVVTFTRYGSIFVGPEIGIGSEGISADVDAGWIDQETEPSRNQLNQFVQGNSITASIYIPAIFDVAGPAVAEIYGNVGSWGWSAFGTQVGIGFGDELSGSLQWSYSFHASDSGPTW